MIRVKITDEEVVTQATDSQYQTQVCYMDPEGGVLEVQEAKEVPQKQEQTEEQMENRAKSMKK